MSRPLDQYVLQSNRFADLGTVSTVFFPPIPDGGKIIKALCNVEVTTVGATVLTFSKNGSAQTPTFTVPSGQALDAAAATVDLAIPVNEGDCIKVATDGGPTSVSPATVTLVIARAAGGA